MADIVMIPIGNLNPHPDNPRKDLGDLTELTESIKAKGILQNLTVVPYFSEVKNRTVQGLYTILIGHRRFAAAQLAGLAELPCAVVDMSYEDQIATMLVENMQRSDLTVLEEAKGFQMMLDLGKTVKEVSEMTGFSDTTIRHRSRLAQLDEKKVRKAFDRGATLYDFIEMESFDDPDDKAKLLDAVGTSDFKNILNRLRTQRRQRELLIKWEEQISRFAIKIDNYIWGSPYSQLLLNGKEFPGTYVKNYGQWNQGTKEHIEPPEDACVRPYYYKLGNNQIDLYRGVDPDDAKAEEAKQAEKKRIEDEFQAKKARFVEMSERHRQLRREFIGSFNAYQKKDTNVFEFLSEALISAELTQMGYGYQQDVRMQALAEYLGITYVKNLKELKYSEFMCLKNTEPERTAVRIAYFFMDSGSFFDSKWNSEKQAYQIVWKENPSLEKCIKLLTYLGYAESTEEIKLRRGSLEDFDIGSDTEDDND